MISIEMRVKQVIAVALVGWGKYGTSRVQLG